jgi:hypothetical protein
MLAAPDKKRLTPIPGNLLEAEYELNAMGEFFGSRGPFRLFAGLGDFKLPFSFEKGHVIPDISFILDIKMPIYLGNTSGKALTRRFYNNKEEVPNGYSESNGLQILPWARKFDEFVVEARQKAVLEAVTPQLKFEEAKRPAQLRLRIADLATSQLAAILHAYGYERSRATSAANVHILHALIQHCASIRKNLWMRCRRSSPPGLRVRWEANISSIRAARGTSAGARPAGVRNMWARKTASRRITNSRSWNGSAASTWHSRSTPPR